MNIGQAFVITILPLLIPETVFAFKTPLLVNVPVFVKSRAFGIWIKPELVVVPPLVKLPEDIKILPQALFVIVLPAGFSIPVPEFMFTVPVLVKFVVPKNLKASTAPL